VSNNGHGELSDFYFMIEWNSIIVNGKAIPLQASTGPEGSRRLRLPDLKTVGT